MNNKYAKTLIIVAAFFILALTTVASYAYFTAIVTGNSDAENTVVTTGYMEVTYIDGSEVGLPTNMLPGGTISKFFKVKNTGNMPSSYNIFLIDVINDFYNTDELVYELISEDGINVGETECPIDVGPIASGVGIDAGETHEYELRITFLNKDYEQDENKGALFNARISLEEGLSVMLNSYDEYTVSEIADNHVLNSNSSFQTIEEYSEEIGTYYFKRDRVKKFYTSGDTKFYTYLEKYGNYLYDTKDDCEYGLYFDVSEEVLHKECVSKLVDGNSKYEIYVADSYLDINETVENIFDSKDQCENKVSEMNPSLVNVSCSLVTENINRTVYDASKVDLCLLENDYEYCFKTAGAWDNGSKHSPQAAKVLADVLYNEDFECNNLFYDNNDVVNTDEIICRGINNNAAVAFKNNGYVILGTGVDKYVLLDQSRKYNSKATCEATETSGEGYCLYYDGYYYYNIGSTEDYNSLESCNSAISNGTSECVKKVAINYSGFRINSSGIIEYLTI